MVQIDRCGTASDAGWMQHYSLQASALVRDFIGVVDSSPALENLVTVLLCFRLSQITDHGNQNNSKRRTDLQRAPVAT